MNSSFVSLTTLSALCLVGACGAPQRQSAARALDESAGTEFVAADKIEVAAATQRSLASGKLLLIDMSAAWCSPCQHFKKDFRSNSDGLADAIAAGWELVELEQTQTELPWGYWDFLPVNVTGVPTFVLMDPVTGAKTSFAGYGKPADFKARLTSFQTSRSIMGPAVENVRSALAATSEVSPDDLFTLVETMAVERGVAEFKNLWAEVTRAMREHPEMFSEDAGFDSDTKAYLENSAVDVLVTEGALDLSGVLSEFPDFSSSTVMKSASIIQNYAFTAPLQRVVRVEGPLAGARQCDAISARAAAAPAPEIVVAPEGATAAQIAEVQRINSANAQAVRVAPVRRTQVCNMLKAATGILSKSEAKALLAGDASAAVKMDGSVFVSLALMAEEFAEAVRVISQEHASDVEYYAGKRSELMRALDAATAAGDQVKIDKIKEDIDFLDFKVDSVNRSFAERTAAYNAGVTHPLRMR